MTYTKGNVTYVVPTNVQVQSQPPGKHELSETARSFCRLRKGNKLNVSSITIWDG